MSVLPVKILLILCGLFDGVVGLVFAVMPATLFRVAHVTPPNHFGYVQFPALLLVIFAIMFFRAAADPVLHREILLYGVALKASYAGLVFWYQFHGGVPVLWIPWAWADAIFLVLLLMGWSAMAHRAVALEAV
ncbi:MAG TPA: hypothetical protein VHZ09_00900 [Acidobacteriaceae bacterium]|jgi:hypothetical protein|nr:hypothetical protein [Acidobacteriaceae bacterium]